jgi:DNA-binding transcriptional LysR family regulator
MSRAIAQPALRPLAWDELQVFDAVCQAGSISGAAQRLHVNHSTVLRRIGALEVRLAVRLFDRLPGGYALTAHGNALRDRIAGVADVVEGAQRHLMGLDAAIRGSIRITTTDTLLPGLLLPLLAQFRQRHPGVQLQVTVNNSFLNLTQREADVAIRGTNKPPGNLVGRHVGDIQTALYASREFLERLGRRHAIDDMVFVGADESLAHLDQAKWLRKHVAAERVALRLDSLSAMVEAVCQGVGAGMLLCPLADARPELVRLAPPDPALDTQVWVLSHPDLRQVARVRALTAFLCEALGASPLLAHGKPGRKNAGASHD